MINLGEIVLQQCNNPPAVRHAHCQEHVTSVSTQERRLYDGLATIESITKHYHLVKIGGGVQLKVTKRDQDGYLLLPMSLNDPIKEFQYFNNHWDDIYEVLGMVYNVTKQAPSYEFPEERMTKAFGKPGRQMSWKMIQRLAEEKMDQLGFDKKGTWMILNTWANRIGTQQGWTKVNEDLLKKKDPKNKVDQSKFKIPKIRSHNESLPFYNADKSNVTNGRFIFPFGKVRDY